MVLVKSLNNELWYKEGNFWRKASPQWEIDDYGEAINSKGDLISNTMMKIVADGDKTDWAYAALNDCMILLKDGRRWPSRMDQDCDALTRLEWRQSQWMYRRGRTEHVRYRPQQNMTRDPYVFFYVACVYLGLPELIEEVMIPWYLYRPGVWAWRKCLIKESRINEMIYKINYSIPAKKDYVQRMKDYKRFAYEKVLEDRPK
jgi:hypothetical protein